MVVLTDYTVLMLIVWGEQYYHYKLLCKLKKFMRGHEVQPDIHDDEIIQSIM